jgi:hypothetical protein
MTDAGERSCYEEEVSDEHKNEWSEAMQDEIKSLYENDFFRFGVFAKGQESTQEQVGVQMKTGEHRSHPRYKARLVVKVLVRERA